VQIHEIRDGRWAWLTQIGPGFESGRSCHSYRSQTLKPDWGSRKLAVRHDHDPIVPLRISASVTGCKKTLTIEFNFNSMLWLFAPLGFQRRHDSEDWSVPKHRVWCISPRGTRPVKNSLIPVESFFHAAVRLQLCRWMLGEFFCDKMLWVPKLTHTAVRDPAKRGAAWRPPVRYQDGFPNNQHAHRSVLMPSQQLLHSGGPPQTKWSSGRHEQDQSRDACVGVERLLELAEICSGKREKRLLTIRH
jgi:hypothetical protein